MNNRRRNLIANATKRKLPPGYTEVKYIIGYKAAGALYPWIDTAINPSCWDSCEAKYQIISGSSIDRYKPIVSANTHAYILYEDFVNNLQFPLSTWTTYNFSQYTEDELQNYDNDDFKVSIYNNDSIRHFLSYPESKLNRVYRRIKDLSINNTANEAYCTYYSKNEPSYQTTYSVFRVVSSSEHAVLCRLWKLKIWHGELDSNNNIKSTLVRDYIPCIQNSNNEAGLYDLISGQFFGNEVTTDPNSKFLTNLDESNNIFSLD